MGASSVAGEAGDAVGAGRRPTVWRNRNFLLLWAAYGISAFGDHLSEMGLWQLMGAGETDRQIQLMGAMTFAFFMPYVVWGAVAGVLADRLSKTRLMIAADLIRAVVVVLNLVTIGWLMRGPLGLQVGWAALAPLVLVGTFAAFFSPARMALLPRLVSDAELTQANSLCSGMGIFASMLSFVVGGYLAAWSVPWNFRFDALTFVISAVLVWRIRTPRRHVEHASRGRAMSLRWSLHYLWDHGRVRQLILVATLFWMASATFNCTIPAMVSHRYKMGLEELGWFRGAMGAGMVIGAIVLSWVRDALRASTVMTWSLFGAAAMLVGFALAWHWAWGMVFAVGAGFFGVCLLIVVATLQQRMVPDYARGRVFGITDQVTMAGLLVSTGVLGFSSLEHIDRYVAHILIGVAATLAVAGGASMLDTIRRSEYGWARCFWQHVNEFYCRWFFRLRRDGICTIPASGPVIVAANHTSSIDPLLIFASCPRRHPGFMVGQEYYTAPLIGRLMRMIGCIPVTRSGMDTAATRRALRHLAGGGVLGIFPAGGIAAPGQHREHRGGAALLALRSEAEIVPVHISGTRYSEGVVAPFFRRCQAQVRFGRPIDATAFGEAESGQARRDLTELIRDRIAALAVQPGDA